MEEQREVIFMDEPSIAKRFKFIVDNFFDGSAKQFSIKTGISRSTVSLLLNGRRDKVADSLFLSVQNVCPEIPKKWLVDGTVSQVRAVKQATIAQIEQELEEARRTIRRLESIIDMLLEERKLDKK